MAKKLKKEHRELVSDADFATYGARLTAQNPEARKEAQQHLLANTERARDQLLDDAGLSSSEVYSALGGEATETIYEENVGDKRFQTIGRIGSGIAQLGTYLTKTGSINPYKIAMARRFSQALKANIKMEAERASNTLAAHESTPTPSGFR